MSFLSLEDLLRKCHHEELLPLARILGVKAKGKKRDALARQISLQLRRRGANDLWNILLRRGDGPSYEGVLEGLAGRNRIAHEVSGVEELEKQVARGFIDLNWKAMSEENRTALWSTWHPEDDAPPTSLAKVSEGFEAPSVRGGWLAARTVMGMSAVMLPLAPGCILPYWIMRPRDDLVWPAIAEIHRLRSQVTYRVTVGVVGSPSSGKDAAISAIFGLKSHNVNPVAGSTSTVEITKIEGARALFVVNTPGMGDVLQSVTEEARQVLDHIDVFVYLVNAQGGVQERELADYQQVLKRNRPVLVTINKIDTIRERDRERYLVDAKRKLGVADGDFLAAAVDPLPQLCDRPIGVDEIRSWLQRHLLELGKDVHQLPWSL